MTNKTLTSIKNIGRTTGFQISICSICKIFLLLTAVTAAVGCGGEKKPNGLPNLFPCTLTITQENSPLENATVLAIPDDSSLDKWPISGTTDAAGIVSLITYGKFNGIPEGSYTILITKEEIVEKKIDRPDDSEHHQGPVKFYSLVDPKMGEKETSPFKITIEKKKNHFDLDAGKKIRLEKKMGPA